MAQRKRQTPQRRSQRTGGRPVKSYGRTSRSSGTHHMMPDGTYMRGAYHGAPTNGGQQTYGHGVECNNDDGTGWSADCDSYVDCLNIAYMCTKAIIYTY